LIRFFFIINYIWDVFFPDSSVSNIIHNRIVEKNTVLRNYSNMTSQISQS
jgi:hypothetical protein